MNYSMITIMLVVLVPIALFPQIDRDVGTISIDIPDILPADTTFNPQATVVNFGTNTETFDVACEILPQIAPESYFSNMRVTDLAPDDSMQVTFLPNFTFVFGVYAVRVYTRLMGDINSTNDTLEKVIIVQTSCITEGSSDMPERFMFRTPTISRGNVKIELTLPEETHVDLRIYDALGKLRKTLVSNRFSAGDHCVNTKINLPIGIYFYNLETELGHNITKKFIVVE